MRALVIVYLNCSKLLVINYLPMQKWLKMLLRVSWGVI